ncbi:hypothetical protein PEX2_032300 [Penicillium expansum]|uniref:Uncharacterized protein n=1 Tax=Penicillium expansum TaxID=27334 RepID=A0A0A2J7A6_PENEN|nr:hypothetical protein PEX2_032300 [Penicillium expansum]KGO51189.1 hypothetical protein PEX2_032300 [Penicillium expansum]
MWFLPEEMIPDFRELVKHLVEFGVPLNETSPLGGALNIALVRGSNLFNKASGFNQDQMVFMVADLVARGADLTQRISETTTDPSVLFCETAENQVSEMHCSSSYLYAVARRNIHDEFHSSDLEKCILSRSEVDLQEAISLSTSMEDSADKQYLAELCVGWPAGLRIFLGAGYHLNTIKLLSHAIRYRCCGSIQVLLNDNNTFIDKGHVELAHWTKNFDVSRLIMHSLAEKRKILQNLAERHLPDHIQAQLHLSKDSLLDTNAINVYSKLQASGINLDPCLKVSRSLVSVYDWIDGDIDAAKMLFKAGFRNLELECDQGLTTLMRLARKFRFEFPVPIRKILKTMLFLISKGADPATRRREDGRTAMHFFGRSVSSNLGQNVMLKFGVLESDFPEWDMITPSKKLKAISEIFDHEWFPLSHRSWTLLETVFVDGHTDACSCACSAQGCLPRTCFFGELASWLGLSLGIQALSEVIRFLGERWAGSMKHLHDTLAPSVVRICMFEYLELAHTCCRMTDRLFHQTEAERAERLDEILDEQKFLIEQVDDQTAFFLSKYHQMDLGLPEFLLEYMSVEITKDPKADDEEKMREYEQEARQIRRLGVVLDESCT